MQFQRLRPLPTQRMIPFLAMILLAILSGRAAAQTLTTLWQFGIIPTDGREPTAGLVQGSDGNFYGTTEHGGRGLMFDDGGYGTVFKITPQGTLTTLYQFGSANTDGANPEAGLVQGSDGNFYGVTLHGGTNNPGLCTDFCGTAFKITPQGTLTTIWDFGNIANVNGIVDGQNPAATMVQGNDGNFYGTTIGGGTNRYNNSTCGTVF
jgi:uncharacterized repeat protein (TIGR03803 family)